jgi:hypothetical protein
MATTEGDETQTGADFLIRPDAGTTELGQCLGVSDAGYIAMLLDLDPNAEPPVCSPTPSPCETDVVGTWTMRDFCLSEDTFPNNQGCPGSEVTIVDRDLQGTYTFADDATFSAQLVSTITTQIVLNTVACFGITCVEHEQSLNESPNLVAVCTEQGQDCSCLMTSTQMIAFEGTHAVTEAGVVLTVDGRAGEPIEACRTGDRLALWQPRSTIEPFFDSLCESPADCEEQFGELHDQWHCV